MTSQTLRVGRLANKPGYNAAMFRRVMVVNRGEVAVRVARTCRRLGVSPWTIYSEADRDAGWLDEFDGRVCVGASRPAHSYLNQDAIVEAIVQSECQAVHPGWGFLAENAIFAARVRQLQIAWIGPKPRTMRWMGDKALARKTVADHDLPTIPGSVGVLAHLDEAREVAERIGYPVLLKATAGGGGRGMRIATDAGDLECAFDEASREAASAFGNDGLYLEKFIASGRHIEFQVLGDTWGRAVCLGERECSVQRRHQKLIEEAPSPALDPETREAMNARVAAATAAIGYEGAGTIEFLRADDGALYFMEMNTRLQVEHTITEAVTGVDLVEWQMRIAAGEALPAALGSTPSDGHAIEVRINAEDPEQDFRPAPGTVDEFFVPLDLGPGTIRVDTHLKTPAKISPFYDSLIAKVIAHGKDRATALETLVRCLEATQVSGLPTTIPAHLKILASPRFIAGDYDTTLIETLGADL